MPWKMPLYVIFQIFKEKAPKKAEKRRKCPFLLMKKQSPAPRIMGEHLILLMTLGVEKALTLPILVGRKSLKLESHLVFNFINWLFFEFKASDFIRAPAEGLGAQ